MTVSSKRAEHIAVTALVLSIIFAIAAFVVSAVCRSFAVYTLGFQFIGGVLVWFALIILFHQRSLAEQEKLDMAQLSKSQSSDTIFQANADRGELFAVAQKRLAVLEKWFMPIFAVLIAAYHLAIGIIYVNRVHLAWDMQLRSPQLAAAFMVCIAFVSFLISRYATGISSHEQCRALRAGGSYLLASAILAFLMCIALALAQFKIVEMIKILDWVVPILMIVLGAETALNVVMDIYRPRIPGQYSRSAFDSRLLGVINEPGGIFHTFASTIDYQFGFKVSQTWFYKLVVEKAIAPLALFLVVTLYLLSCIVIVNPGEEAIIEHLGAFDKKSVVGPGLHWKLPWPFDIARKYTTTQIQQVSIGFVESDVDKAADRKPLLWGEQHYEEEYNLLVGTKTEAAGDEEGAVPVSIVRAAVPVQYVINDLYSFVYNHSDAEKMLETICYRQLVRFAASAKIETEGEEGNESLLGAGRRAAAAELIKRIQAQADEEKLGVQIVFLGLQGVHPPPDVAQDYQDVIGSVQKKQAAVLNALADYNKILASFCGSVSRADELYALAYDHQQAKESADPEKIDSISRKLHAGFEEAKGDIFKTLSDAQSYAFEKATIAEAVGMRFTNQLRAYRAAPDIYIRQYRLAMLEESLANIRKYVVVGEKEDTEVYIIDLQEKLAPSLYDLNLDALGESK